MKEKLYPKLTEQGKEEAELLVKSIIKKVTDALDENDFYCNIPCFIESDSWTNFRNSIMDGMNDYSTGKAADLYDFKQLRQVILRENYDQLTKDLNQDNLEEIKKLKETIGYLEKARNY